MSYKINIELVVSRSVVILSTFFVGETVGEVVVKVHCTVMWAISEDNIKIATISKFMLVTLCHVKKHIEDCIDYIV